MRLKSPWTTFRSSSIARASNNCRAISVTTGIGNRPRRTNNCCSVGPDLSGLTTTSSPLSSSQPCGMTTDGCESPRNPEMSSPNRVPGFGNVVGGDGNVGQQARFPGSTMPGEVQRPAAIALQPLFDENARTDAEPLRTIRFEQLGLERSDRAGLRERINPHRVERRQVTGQSAHQRAAAAEVARCRQSVLSEQVDELSGRRFHDRRIPSWPVRARWGAGSARRECPRSRES